MVHQNRFRPFVFKFNSLLVFSLHDVLFNHRHSWTCEDDESSTSFGRTIIPVSQQDPSLYDTPRSSKPAEAAYRTPSSPIPVPHSDPCSLYDTPRVSGPASRASSSPTSSSGSSRRNSKLSDKGGPPPPPRRAPTTKLSTSNSYERPHARSASFGAFQGGINDVYFPTDDTTSNICHGNSPDDELPVVPPALPLYTPHVLTPKSNGSITNPNEVDLPAPPPPDVLLYDTLKNMRTHPRKANVDERNYDLPPPPPSL